MRVVAARFDGWAYDAAVTVTRAERLDKLPFTRRHGRLLYGSGVGWALDAMDIGLISFIMAALAQEWSLSNGQLSLLGSIGFMGMALGASLGGLLADRIGRRQVFALTLLVYGLATGLSALSTGLVVLLVLRFIVGVGLGAELPVASTLVSEFAPSRIRGRVVVALESFWAVGWLAAACVGYFLVPASENGWRWALALGAVPAIWAIVVRLHLPESVRFLESKGRHAEAEAAVADFEASAGIVSPVEGSGAPSSASTTARDISEARSFVTTSPESGATSPTANTSAADVSETLSRGAAASRVSRNLGSNTATPSSVGWAELWRPRFRRTTIALWTTWFAINFAYYGAFIWLPTLLSQNGMTLVKSFEFTLFMTLAQLPGYAVAAILVEVWGRRATLATFLAGSAIGAVAFATAPQLAAAIAPGSDAGRYAVTLTAACVLSFFNLGAWGALYAVTPEVYPTAMRATGSGAATAFGRIAAMLAPLMVPVLNTWGGLPVLFVVFGVAFTLAALAALALPEYRGEALEEA